MGRIQKIELLTAIVEQQNIIIYKTADGKSSVALYARDGEVWLNQKQLAELFATSKQNISLHITNILKEKRTLVREIDSLLRVIKITSPLVNGYLNGQGYVGLSAAP